MPPRPPGARETRLRRVTSAGWSLLFVGVLLDMSCAAGTEKLVRRAVPAGIDETLEAFEDPKTQQRLKKLLGLPEVQEAAKELGEGLTAGALAGLTDDQRMAKARQLSEDYVAALSRAVGKGLKEDVSPAVVEATEDAVERAVRAALSPETRQNAAALAEALTRRTVTTLSESLRDDLGPATQAVLEKNLGPAMQRVIEDNLGPALRHAIEQDLTPAVKSAAGELTPTAGKVSREVSREMVLGVIDALETAEKDERFDGVMDRFWGRLNTTINQGIRASEILAWILVLIVLILGLLLIRSIVRRRQLEAEREHSERMVLGILQVLQKTGEVRVENVIEKVRERDPELARSPYMSELLRRMVAKTRDLFDGRPDFDGKPDK